jgi:hypothetical protein
MTLLALGLLLFTACSPEMSHDAIPKDSRITEDNTYHSTFWEGPPYVTGSAVLFVLLAGGYLLLRAHRLKQPDAWNEKQFYFFCPKCRTKIGYSRRRIGVSASCRTCSAVFTFPVPKKESSKKPGR